MSKVYVNFSDSNKTVIVDLFSCPQDVSVYQNQDQIETTDQRYIDFIHPELTLSVVKLSQIKLLQKSYQEAVNSPIPFTNAAGVASTYPAGNSISLNGQTATQNLSNIITIGSTAWQLGRWLDSNGVAQVFTFVDLQNLAVAMGQSEQLDWLDLVSKVAEIQEATTVEQVQAITF